jgi:hypothetical protein
MHHSVRKENVGSIIPQLGMARESLTISGGAYQKREFRFGFFLLYSNGIFFVIHSIGGDDSFGKGGGREMARSNSFVVS